MYILINKVFTCFIVVENYFGDLIYSPSMDVLPIKNWIGGF